MYHAADQGPAKVAVLVVGLAISLALGYLFWSMRPQPWQVVNLLAFLANVAAVRSIPRLDSSNTMLQPLNYLTPASYAFAIWGLIYFLEYGFVCWQLLPRANTEVMKRMSPWWTGANLCQVSWCLLFRPRFDTPQLLWLSAVALSGIAFCLGKAHALLATAPDGNVAYVPISLHFGWTTAAALVNWNGYTARCTSEPTAKLAVALLSAAAASYFGASLTVDRRSALYGLTVAWALLAVARQTLTSEVLEQDLGQIYTTGLGLLELTSGVGILVVALATGFLHCRKQGNSA